MADSILHKYNSVAGTVPAAASMVARELAINTADGKVYTKKSDASIVEIGEPDTKSITVSAPTASENIVMFYTAKSLKVTNLMSVVKGTSPSVTYKLNYGTDTSAAGTAVVTAGTTCTNVSTGLNTTTFNNATISAGSWVWLTTSATSGTVTAFHLTVVFD